MLKVMIVEDDIFDYTHLKNIIDWNEEGFQISEQLKNVEEAKNRLKAEKFDIIITDMKMPGKNGSELIKFTAENFPEVKTIALSGYKEFKYVKKSLKAGAEDYILKHELKQAKLKKLLSSVKENIKNQQEIKNNNIFEESFYLDQKNILIQNFAEKLLRGHFSNKKEIKKQIELLSINFDLKNIVITVGQFDNYQQLRKKYSSSKLLSIKRSFINMADEILKENGNSFAVLNGEKKFFFLFSFQNNSELEINNSTASALNRIKSALKNYINITASFAVSNILQNPLEITESYNQTAKLLEDKFYQGRDMIVYQNRNNRVDNKKFSLDIKEEKKLQKYIEQKDFEALENNLKKIFAEIAEAKPGLSVLKMTLISLINIVNTNIKENNLREKNIFTQETNPYQKLEKLNSLVEFKSWILEVYRNLIRELKNKNHYSDLINKTLMYIDKNYNQDLTLSQTAAEIGVSYSYLSRKFKKECGLGFSDYLNKLRIKKAKKLIDGSYNNIKEIVNQVGFNNYNYFFKVFKDQEGLTPREYENKDNN